MKKTFTKLLLLVLALACTLSLLASCHEPSDKDDVTSSTSAPETSEADTTTAEPAPTPAEPTDFERYASNTSAPTGHNSALKSNEPVTETFRATFKVQEHGAFDYKFFFSNNVNSTYASGENSYREMPTQPYEIESAFVGTTHDQWIMREFSNKTALSFDGEKSRSVDAGETFWSDTVSINVPEGQYLVFEWTVTYTLIPSTMISTTMAGMKQSNPSRYQFSPTANIPMPDLVGCDRGAKLRLGFIGDSITMGEFSGATTADKATYEFWAAQIADGLGVDASVWNLGLGYARGDDAANSPSWLYKAKQCDVVGICFGVNDINSGAYGTTEPATKDEILADVSKIASELKEAGVEVIIFSTPPYTFGNDAKFEIWRESCAALKTLAEENGYAFFDMASYLGKEDAPHEPAYGGHPNNVGCTKVAEGFLAAELVKIPE